MLDEQKRRLEMAIKIADDFKDRRSKIEEAYSEPNTPGVSERDAGASGRFTPTPAPAPSPAPAPASIMSTDPRQNEILKKAMRQTLRESRSLWDHVHDKFSALLEKDSSESRQRLGVTP